MTKSQEIALVDALIAKCGPDSYVGPWLTSVRGDIVADIRNDIPISALMPSQARAEAAKILDAAETHSKQLMADAERRAAEMIASARSACESSRASTRRCLERAIREL